MDRNLDMQLLDGAVRTLADLGIRAAVLARETTNATPHRTDATLHLAYGALDETRPIEIRRYVTPVALGAIAAQLAARHDRPLVITDYITPPVAERMRALNLQFVDAAGNAYIKTPNTLIWVRGQPPRRTVQPGQPTGRAFEPSGLRVLFLLLCDPRRVNEPYRDLARDTGVAHGTVGWVMADLQARGFVAHAAKTRRRRALLRVEQLLPQWAEAYARVLRPTLLLGRYRMEDRLTLTKEPAPGPQMLLGGEIAAARLTRNLKPATATLWANKVEPKFLVANQLIADPHGPIEVLRKFWTIPAGRDTVPDVLIYADLLAIGDARTLEIAREIQGMILDRLVEKA